LANQALIAFSSHRKIGRNHLAFYRAWLQGLDLKVAADRYLESSLDLRLARATLGWIQETLAMAARRHGKHALVRLLRLPLGPPPPEASAQQPAAAPSLEAFRAAADPDGFYSEAELTALFLDAYPQSHDKQARHRARLIERQLAALVWLEDLLATDPQLQDSVAAWFDDRLAARLILAGIGTLGDLQGRIRTHGYRWWVTVPRLGEKGAARLVAWLTRHESSLGTLPAQGHAPQRSMPATALIRPAITAIMPLESFVPPAALDGSRGVNRGSGRCQLDAENDYQAIQAWLKARALSPHTERAYRREAERLLLWAVLERAQALSSLTIDDVTAYRDWLGGLARTPPERWTWRIAQAEWLASRSTPRWSPSWRPFEGALASRSQVHAYTILKSLFEWLCKVRYLESNPWEAVSARYAGTLSSPSFEVSHAFTRSQWRYLIGHLGTLPDDDATHRMRFVLPFAYATGLRLAELVDARLGRLCSMPLKDELGVRWMLKVLGKGNRWRSVPMPAVVMDALRVYLTRRGLDADPAANAPDTPLVAPLAGRANLKSLNPSTLYKALRGFFKSAAVSLDQQGLREDALKIEQATTHWLRHTRGSHSAETMPLNLIQRLLGHASVATTGIYTSSDDESLYLALNEGVASALD
jgi:site-specific recombinase XerD